MSGSGRSFKVACAFSLFHNLIQMFVIPSKFFFTHVLMAVLANGAIKKLL